MVSRRAALATVLSVTSAGCSAARLAGDDDSTDGLTSTGDTGSKTDAEAGGNPAPWGDPQSEMDIGVDNRLDDEITATVDTGVYRETVSVRSGSAWVSGNVVEPSNTPLVTLSVDDGREKEVQWESESENEGYLLFEVRPDRIDYEMATKGEVLRTERTESPVDG